MQFTRLPADFVDRLRDVLCTVQMAQRLMRPRGDDERMTRIVRLAVTQTRAEAGVLLLLDEDRGDLRVAAACGEVVTPLVGRFIARAGVSAFAIEDGSAIAVAESPRARAVTGAAPIDDIADQSGLVTRSVLAVPLTIYDRVTGALELRNAPAATGFTVADKDMAEDLAYLAAAAVEEYRGDRHLLALFGSVLPRALDPDENGVHALASELERWLAELRQTAAWRRQIGLTAQVRALCDAGEDAVTLVETVLDAIIARERRRQALHDVAP